MNTTDWKLGKLCPTKWEESKIMRLHTIASLWGRGGKVKQATQCLLGRTVKVTKFDQLLIYYVLLLKINWKYWKRKYNYGPKSDTTLFHSIEFDLLFIFFLENCGGLTGRTIKNSAVSFLNLREQEVGEGYSVEGHGEDGVCPCRVLPNC